MTSKEDRQGWVISLRRWIQRWSQLDFNADALDRSRSAKGLLYTKEEIAERRDILSRLKDASGQRGSAAGHVRLWPKERELVDKEIGETRKRSGGIGLAEYRPKEGQRLELKDRPYTSTKDDAQLIRSDLIFCNGTGIISLLQRNQIAKGFQVVEKDGRH